MTFPAGPDALDAAWVEDVLREGLVFPDARVRRIATQVIGVGFGLDGTSARLTLDGDGVPATLVAKWSSVANARVESRFYREIAPRLDLRLAALLGAQFDDETKRGVLLLSDVAPARQGDTIFGATAAESEALTDAMASLHAAYWGAAEMPDLAALPRWVHGPEKPGQGLDDALPRFLAQWSDRLPAAALVAAERLPERVIEARATFARAPTTLVHADLHLDNVLFLDDGAPVILDWPSACRGPAAVDFARVLVEGMTFTSRRARQESLTRRYLAALAIRGVEYDAALLRADVAAVANALYAAAIRWAAGPNAVNPDVPRVALIVDSLVRNTADAAIDPECGAA